MNSIKYRRICQGMEIINMLKLILGGLFVLIGLALYCCVRCGSEYDKEIDDLEQEKFIQDRHSK